MDMGTVILPFPLPLVAKTATLSFDANGNNAADPGDVLTWTITVTNQDSSPMGAPIVFDTVPTNTTYISNSTFINGVLESDNATGTAVPLDDDGINLPPTLATLQPGESHVVTFQTSLNTFGGTPYTSVTNTAIVESDQGTRGRDGYLYGKRAASNDRS